jgi:hypothetical protein
MSLKAGGGKLFARLAFGLAVFTSAFLLFQVQLLLGKFLLPWFGGTSGVWATCLLFFQMLLLGGYFYAHKISISWRLPSQGKIHLAFLALGTVWMLLAWFFWGSPLLPGPSWKPAPGAAPIAGILKLLLISVGVPFLLLSSTGPLLQNWYAHLELSAQKKAPYFLYALSNAGSLLGLLSYPLFLEPVFRLSAQSWFWGAGFGFSRYAVPPAHGKHMVRDFGRERVSRWKRVSHRRRKRRPLPRDDGFGSPCRCLARLCFWLPPIS